MTKNEPCTFCNAKIELSYFQELLKTALDNSIPLKTTMISLELNASTMQYNKLLGVQRRPAAIQKCIWNTHR